VDPEISSRTDRETDTRMMLTSHRRQKPDLRTVRTTLLAVCAKRNRRVKGSFTPNTVRCDAASYGRLRHFCRIPQRTATSLPNATPRIRCARTLRQIREANALQGQCLRTAAF